MDKIIDIARDVLKNYPRVYVAYLHGSRAQKSNHQDSDIDIVLMGEGLDYEEFKKIKNSLDAGFEKSGVYSRLDLGIINRDSDSLFAHRVFNNSKIIVDNDRLRRLREETALELKYFDEGYFRKQMFHIVKTRLQI